MKKILLTCLVSVSLLLSGCTSVVGDIRATIQYALSEPEDVDLAPEELAALPYTALYVNWQSKPRVMVVLGFIEGEEFHWVTGDRETIVTRNGRVTRTAKLDYEVVAVSDVSDDPLRCVLKDECLLSWSRNVRFKDASGNEFSRSVVSDFELGGTTSIELPLGTKEVVEVFEHGYFALDARGQGKQRFTNTFWLESDGHVVKSEQRIHPMQAPLVIKQAKWVGRDE